MCSHIGEECVGYPEVLRIHRGFIITALVAGTMNYQYDYVVFVKLLSPH